MSAINLPLRNHPRCTCTKRAPKRMDPQTIDMRAHREIINLRLAVPPTMTAGPLDEATAAIPLMEPFGPEQPGVAVYPTKQYALKALTVTGLRRCSRCGDLYELVAELVVTVLCNPPEEELKFWEIHG